MFCASLHHRSVGPPWDAPIARTPFEDGQRGTRLEDGQRGAMGRNFATSRGDPNRGVRTTGRLDRHGTRRPHGRRSRTANVARGLRTASVARWDATSLRLVAIRIEVLEPQVGWTATERVARARAGRRWGGVLAGAWGLRGGHRVNETGLWGAMGLDGVPAGPEAIVVQAKSRSARPLLRGSIGSAKPPRRSGIGTPSKRLKVSVRRVTFAAGLARPDGVVRAAMRELKVGES